MRYVVGIREVYVRDVVVEAESPAEAIEKAKDCENHVGEFDTVYSHEIDSELWTAEEFNGDVKVKAEGES